MGGFTVSDSQKINDDRRAPDEVVVSVVRHERRRNWHADGGCAKLIEVDQRFKDGDERMARIENKLDANTAKTDATAKGVEEVLDILNLAKSFFRILGIVGTLAKWLALVAAPVLALYYTIKGGPK
jgi:hypothetical protein